MTTDTSTLETPVDDDLTSYPVSGGEPLTDENDTVEEAAPVADEIPGDATGETKADEIPGISAELAAQAAAYGLDPEDFGTGKALEKALRHLDRKTAEFVRQPAPTPQAKPEPQAPVTLEKLDLTKILTPGKYEEEIEKAFTAMNDFYAKQTESVMAKLEELSSVKPQVEQFGSFLQQQESQRNESELDSYFNSLGDEWKEVFGQGSIRELPPKLAEERRKVAQEMLVLQAGDQAMGRPPSNLKQLAQRAHRLAFGDRHETIARNKLKAEVKAKQSGALAKPSAKTGAPVDPRSRIRQLANDVYRKAGYVIPTDDIGDDDLG